MHDGLRVGHPPGPPSYDELNELQASTRVGSKSPRQPNDQYHRTVQRYSTQHQSRQTGNKGTQLTTHETKGTARPILGSPNPPAWTNHNKRPQIHPPFQYPPSGPQEILQV